MNLGIDKRSEMVYTNKRRRERHTETQAHDPLAQVVEHLTFNQVVPGSSPGCLMEEKKIMMGDLLFLYYEITSDVNSDYEKCEVSM